jgi:hypothetical protein
MTPTDPGFQGPTPVQAAQTRQLPLQPPAEEPAGRRRRWRRWAKPLVAFVLGVGVGVGGAGNGTDVTTTPQYQSLQAQLDGAQDRAGELSDEVAAGQEQARQAAVAAQAQIEEQTAAISRRATALDQREQELVARESALRAAEQAAGSSRTGNQQLAVRIHLVRRGQRVGGRARATGLGQHLLRQLLGGACRWRRPGPRR